jgi:iron complex transport system substrate-binding protein
MPDFLPQRIVSLQPSITVILDRLGELQRVIACTRYCAEVCPAVRDGSRYLVADSWTAQSGQILAARPDLVIASVPYQEKAVSEILKSGARFLGLAPRSLADIYADIMAIAGVVGVPGRGRDVIAEMETAIDEVRRRAATAPHRPRVFCEEWGKPIIASQPWVKEMVEAAAGCFIGEPGRQTTAEGIRAADPEIFCAAWCGAGDRVPLQKLIRDRNWDQIAAARAGRVFCISDELLNTPAPTLVGGLHALAWALHPGLFPQPSGIRVLTPTESHA